MLFFPKIIKDKNKNDITFQNLTYSSHSPLHHPGEIHGSNYIYKKEEFK